MLALVTDVFIIRSMQKLPVSPNLFAVESEHMHDIRYNVPRGSGDVLEADNVGCHTGGTLTFDEPDVHPLRDVAYANMGEALAELGIDRKNTFLSNGGRLYKDPSGLETATAESVTAAEATLRSLDESWLVEKLFGLLLQKDIIAGYDVNRKAVDHFGLSRGIHLNTSMNPEFMQSSANTVRFINTFTLLNIAKGALFGSGGLMISRQDGRTHYYHSPRLAVVTQHQSRGSSTAKSLVRMPDKYDYGTLRVEHTTSDALNFAFPLQASLVMARAATMLLEAGHEGNLPRVIDPVRTAYRVGKLGANATIYALTKEGKDVQLSPLDVLRNIAERALTLPEVGIELTTEIEQVLKNIILVADTTSKDMFGANTQVESVLRLQKLLKRVEELEHAYPHLKKEEGGAWNSPELCRQDYLWDRVGSGTAEALRNKGVVGWLGFAKPDTMTERKKRIVTPPQNTRACLRAAAVKNKTQEVTDWSEICVSPSRTIKLHPLQTTFEA